MRSALAATPSDKAMFICSAIDRVQKHRSLMSGASFVSPFLTFRSRSFVTISIGSRRGMSRSRCDIRPCRQPSCSHLKGLTCCMATLKKRWILVHHSTTSYHFIITILILRRTWIGIRLRPSRQLAARVDERQSPLHLSGGEILGTGLICCITGK